MLLLLSLGRYRCLRTVSPRGYHPPSRQEGYSTGRRLVHFVRYNSTFLLNNFQDTFHRMIWLKHLILLSNYSLYLLLSPWRITSK